MEYIELTKQSFHEMAVEQNVPMIIDFQAPWCGYCKRLNPVLDQLLQELSDRNSPVRIGKINIDDEPELAESLGVEVIPTLIAFKNGKPGTLLVNPGSKAQIVQWMEQEMGGRDE